MGKSEDALTEHVRLIVGGITPVGPSEGHFTGTIRGQTVGFDFVSDDDRPVYAVEMTATVGHRRLDVLIGSQRTTSLSLPRLSTGDHAFDERIRVFGEPPEVTLAFLDAATRERILSFGETHPEIVIRNGRLTLRSSIERLYGSERALLDAATAPRELERRLEALLELAARAAATFDAHVAGIAKAGGPSAATRWVAEQEDKASQRERQRSKRLALIIGVGLAAVALVIVVAGAVAIWQATR